ncbi:MAG: HNH endonuclease signature motif containing protein [Cyanobacteria bacterium P01_F01_bin.153]
MSRTYIPAALRREVAERAAGCCEYCKIPEVLTFASHEVDHVIAEKHGGATVSENLALACVLCNQRKGSDIASVDPATGKIERLFNPRADRWGENFTLEEVQIAGRSAVGRTTVALLQLNGERRLAERRLAIEAGLFEDDG